MNLAMQVMEVSGRQVLVRWRVEGLTELQTRCVKGLTEWQTRWLQVGDTLNLSDKIDVKLSWN